MLVLLLLPARDAYAYLDPGTGSFLLQAVIAVVMGALLTMKLYWVRVKSFFSSARGGGRPNEPRGDDSLRDQSDGE